MKLVVSMWFCAYYNPSKWIWATFTIIITVVCEFGSKISLVFIAKVVGAQISVYYSSFCGNMVNIPLVFTAKSSRRLRVPPWYRRGILGRGSGRGGWPGFRKSPPDGRGWRMTGSCSQNGLPRAPRCLKNASGRLRDEVKIEIVEVSLRKTQKCIWSYYSNVFLIFLG